MSANDFRYRSGGHRESRLSHYSRAKEYEEHGEHSGTRGIHRLGAARDCFVFLTFVFHLTEVQMSRTDHDTAVFLVFLYVQALF